jgi:hypothetical protein
LELFLSLTLPGPLDLPLLVFEIFSLALILRICVSLYRVSRYAFDDRSLLLFAGFLLLSLSLLLSVVSIFIDDLFTFSSLVLFSIYASLAGYISILSARFLGEPVLLAIVPLAQYYLYGELASMILSTTIALGSRSRLVSTGFLLLSLSHLLRLLSMSIAQPLLILLLPAAELLRVAGFLALSIGIGGAK